MEEGADNHEVIYPLLDRLVRAGWALSWSSSESTGIQVRWNEELDAGRGGENRFLDFVELWAQLCPEKPLSELDQAMLVALEQIALDARE